MGPRHPNRLDRTAPSTQRSLTLVGRRTGRNFGVIRGRRPGPCQPRPEPALDADCATRHHHPADLNDPPQVVPCSWRSPGPYELAHDNRDAIEAALSLARWTADRVREAPHLHLVVEPQLSVVAFTREGWDAGDYQRFSDQLLADQVGFVVPSNHDGKPILRCAFLHPETTTDMVAEVLDLL